MKIRIVSIIFFGAILLFSGCSVEKYSVVSIPVPTKKAIDFIKYEHIYFSPFDIKGTPEGLSPYKVINFFFLDEFPKVIKKKIEGPVYPDKFPEFKKNSLLIKGKVFLKINRRSVINTKKIKHKKRKVFVKVENWEIQTEIEFFDPLLKKTIFKKMIKSTLNSANPKRPDYNFRYLFRKTTEKFIRRIMRVGKTERRFLLKK